MLLPVLLPLLLPESTDRHRASRKSGGSDGGPSRGAGPLPVPKMLTLVTTLSVLKCAEFDFINPQSTLACVADKM